MFLERVIQFMPFVVSRSVEITYSSMTDIHVFITRDLGSVDDFCLGPIIETFDLFSQILSGEIVTILMAPLAVLVTSPDVKTVFSVSGARVWR